MFFVQVHEGVNGIAGFRQVKLYVRNLELIVVADGCPNQVITIKFME
jgi:hypothetical protein